MMDIQVRETRFDAGKPKVCVPLTGRTFDEIIEQATEAKKYAEVIEWRADYYDDIFDDDKLNTTLLALRDEIRNIPLIFNLRTKESGGQLELNLNQYRHINEFAVSTRAIDLADVEVSVIDQLSVTFIKWLQALDVRVILSYYNFDETPEDAIILFRLNLIEHLGADMAKIVLHPENEADVLRQMGIVMKAQTFVTLPVISVSLGRVGKLSQVCGSLDGSCMAYGCLKDNVYPDAQIEAEKLNLIINELR
ncbi:type I 3-dehydroquinate dehydratase [Enterococcus hermanniensis]|uniref:3-dehydroquinate dehydratase n=1 Tax=Enterococcus hermanniensis TaxID=249189 RepID=A0A1L8TH28_9ENTE|nr:type I 3-dehydroquinate dehydratase [Enterococcus hermanniensis]OJG43635.1 3-dehydroquinate dehydratase, type I [Enterococcus hermanniensis]